MGQERCFWRCRPITGQANPYLGSSFESWLHEKGFGEEVSAAAIKSVLVEQLAVAMKENSLTKARRTELMRTSRTQYDRLLDSATGSATFEALLRAARIVGRQLRVELV